MMDAGLTLARLHPDKPFGGSVHLSWKGLALSDLPLSLLPRLPVAQLDGLTSGELSVTPKPDLSMDFDLRLRLDEARMVRDVSLTAPRGVDADLRTTGHWDPADDQIELTEFAYETPGLRLHKPTAGCVLAIDSQGVRPFHLRLGGHVKDWAALGREMPELSLFLSSSGADVSGQADFTLELQQQRQEDRLVLSIDAKDTQLAIGPHKASVVVPPPESPKASILRLFTPNRKSICRSRWCGSLWVDPR